MGVELHSQGVQPRFAEAVLQPLQAQFRIHIALIVSIRLNRSGHDPVDQPEPELPADHQDAEDLMWRQRTRGVSSKRYPESLHDVEAQKRQDWTRCQMREHPHPKLLTREGQTPVESDDQWSDHPPRPELIAVHLEFLIEPP